MTNGKLYWRSMTFCALALVAEVACCAKSFCTPTGLGKPLLIQLELKNGYLPFSIPTLYLSSTAGRQWVNGEKVGTIWGSFDERTLCPYLVAREDYRSKAHDEESPKYERHFRLEYHSLDFVSWKRKDFIKRSKNIKEVVKSDVSGTDFEKYVQNYPDGTPMTEALFPTNDDVYIECPSGPPEHLQCRVIGMYSRDVGYDLMFPKADVFSYNAHIARAMPLFNYFDVNAVHNNFTLNHCEK